MSWRLAGNVAVGAAALLAVCLVLVAAGWWPEAPGVVIVQCEDGLRAVRAEPPHPCPRAT